MSAELVFMTTNRAKLAHLKYLGAKHGIGIHGFRERTYYGSYSEPRIKDREQLLRQSYASALHQWTRAKQNLDNVFFLEDTSVRIEALSISTETPGVDIKYWMSKMSLNKLNRLLTDNGGSRLVSVRSDIVAHIPVAIRKARGIKEQFIWVNGATEGTIVNTEEVFAGNLVHPWLDAKTFNKWFAPIGCDKAISQLPIDLANIHDFRRKAFESLLGEFTKLGIAFPNRIETRAKQYSLPGFERTPPVVVVCGFSCAGKTTAADWLSKQYGFLHIEASDYMYRAFRERHGLTKNIKIGEFAESALLEEPSIAARPIAEFIQRCGYAPVVVTGFRSPAEIEDLSARLEGTAKVLVIFLEADFQTRLERAVARNREPMDAEKLTRRDDQEVRMGLDKIQAIPTNIHIQNVTRKSDLSKKFKSFYEDKFDRSIMNSMDPHLSSLGPLESLILQSMLGPTLENKGWTTSEVARLIGLKFGIAKEKDNVSRYFTQEYRPFYEIIPDQAKVRYKLSTTGESVARILKRDSLSVN